MRIETELGGRGQGEREREQKKKQIVRSLKEIMLPIVVILIGKGSQM